jgi:hypothetical protein
MAVMLFSNTALVKHARIAVVLLENMLTVRGLGALKFALSVLLVHLHLMALSLKIFVSNALLGNTLPLDAVDVIQTHNKLLPAPRLLIRNVLVP